MRLTIARRIAVTIVAIIVTETLVCAAAAAPVAWCWWQFASLSDGLPMAARLAIASVFVVPSYVAFALLLMLSSSLATFLTRARTPASVSIRIADFDPHLMTWVRYMAAIHLVRCLAGTLVRGTPVWTWYLRLNGARMGRRVYVNTLTLSDYNLLDFGDDVVVGADVHVSGHTVERGCVATGPVRLNSGVTIGVGCVVDIDVVVGERTQVGALSFVPKHARLESDSVYVGIPVSDSRRRSRTA